MTTGHPIRQNGSARSPNAPPHTPVAPAAGEGGGDGPGRGNIYETWNGRFSGYGGDFTRSTNGGATFTQPTNLPGSPFWGTLSVGPQSQLYISGATQFGSRT